MYRERFSLEGKVALVTGASRGIGAAIARGFAEFGARVALTSRKLEGLQKVADDIKQAGGTAAPFPANVGHIDKLEALVQSVVNKFGKIDILVNNAAANPKITSALHLEEEVWNKIMDVNLKAVFFLSQQVARSMEKTGGGTIINISSSAGLRPSKGLGAYSISKAGVIMLTRVLATELAGLNIRVNCIAPGLIETDFSAALRSNKDALEAKLAHIPLHRVGQTEEIVGAAVYLASQASSFTTGTTIPIMGGE